MTTQIIEFGAPQELTITSVKLYILGDDTVVAESAAIEKQLSIYHATFSDLPENTYKLLASISDGTIVASWWVDIEQTDKTYPAYEMPQSAIINGVNQIIEQLEQSNQQIIASIEQSNIEISNEIQQSNDDIKQYINKLAAAKDRIILGKCENKNKVNICRKS